MDFAVVVGMACWAVVPLCLVGLLVVFAWGQMAFRVRVVLRVSGGSRGGVMGLFPSPPLPSVTLLYVCVQPYAWESREHLRRLLVGQDVRFAVEYKVPSSGREYGTVWVRVAGEVKCANEEQVSAGWAEVRTGGKSE